MPLIPPPSIDSILIAIFMSSKDKKRDLGVGLFPLWLQLNIDRIYAEFV
ncbi:hypothetical protein AB07_1765 [Citrobacter freundii]|nr:hypothetical protein AB07_1765 [Citrobacter freundii]